MQPSTRGLAGWGRDALAALAYYLYNSWITHIPFYSVRHAWLRGILRYRIGSGSAVHMGCFVTGRKLTIGRNTVINRRCYLDGRGGLAIGDNVSVSPECYLISLGHDKDSADFRAVPGPVTIGDRAWLGARALVMPGVSLGEGAVVAAGAVVSKGCGPFEVLAGVPARKIGERNRALDYTLSYFPWFDGDIRPGR